MDGERQDAPWPGPGGDRAKARLEVLHINTTKTCNLACVFCYDNAERAKTPLLPLDVYERVAEDAIGLGLRKVILSGGEPLTRKDWRDIAGLFCRDDIEVSLATNGTLIKPETVAFLADLPRYSMSISIDGGAQVHDRIRGKQGAFDATLKGLALLKEAGIRFDINATLSRDNLSEVSALARIARDFKCYVRLSLLHPNGRGSKMEEGCLDADEIFRVREYCHVLRSSGGINLHLNLPPLLCYLDDIHPARGAACGWATHYCGLMANGDVTICGVASGETGLIAGNVRDQSLADIWRNSELFNTTRAFRTEDLKGVCGRCPFNAFCGGACRLSAYRQDGDFLAPYFLCQSFYDQGYIPEDLLDEA